MIYRTQKYACCQLISAINARIFLGLGDVSDEEFDNLVDIARCRNGAALKTIVDCYQRLGLVFEQVNDAALEWITQRLPVEISFYDETHGFHSALVISVENNKVRLLNTTREWMNWDTIDWPPIHLRRFRAFSLS